MNIRITLMASLFIGTIAFSSCTEEEPEECVQDTVCEVDYSTCCTDDACTYTYDGVEYTDVDDVVEAIDCQNAVVLESIRSSVLRARAGL